MADYDYDLLTIGAGSGGVRASRLAGGFGARVAVVEGSRIGGTCVMRGCVPKKLLVYGAQYANDLEDMIGYGWSMGGVAFDWPSLITAKNRELDRLEGVYRTMLRNSNVALLEGRARFLDAHSVDIDGKTVTADKILIAVGGWPQMPVIPGIEHAITSNEALDLMVMPERLTIVGGGFIAVEFACIFNALGVDVSVVIRKDKILRGFDADIRDTLTEEMVRRGITIVPGTVINRIDKRPGGGYRLIRTPGEAIDTDLVMYATGRAPNTAGLGLEAAGVKVAASGAVIVDEWNRTNVDTIYAIGDVTDRIALTPVAINEAIAFAHTVFNDTPRVMDYENVASAVFTQPPVGTVGLTEEQARARGPVRIFRTRFRAMKHVLAGRDEKTMMKLVVDARSDRVLGCHMVGADAPEIIQGLAVALKCGATKAQFDATIGIHPTAAEEFVTMRDPLPEPVLAQLAD
ncbi:glutathione-disulfide reductase [Rhodospirillum rubrum]|uniref:glutathione-disulfide reductase n=1 Tax=Rhodospirillum rubrum TaxID=1085 RepID=UPI0019075AB2|nr:glutathione-disulfide reductase [Rhodospirillum rubrum]MBK1663992.1 glutathione-disulfide reductase [Rhodospirillum rubrum]MBK1675450.1 glutathione-disulfide reductase [Rhodospirillum rubrum]